MNRKLFARAIAVGVESALALEFDEALKLIDSPYIESGDVADENGEVAHWSYLALQVLEVDGGKMVELPVSATDGMWEETVHVYCREKPNLMLWSGMPSENK